MTRFIVALSVLASACTRTVSIAGGDGQCTVRSGMSYSQVLLSCGVPTGFRMQPKVAAWMLGEACSAPVYVYPGGMVAFGCRGEVTAVAIAPSTVGIDVDSQFLREEIRARRHVEAAIVQLATADGGDPRTQALIVEVESLGTPLSAAASSRARELSGRRQPKE